MKKLRSKKVDKKKEDVSIEAIEEVSTIKNRKETEKSTGEHWPSVNTYKQTINS